MKKTLFTIAILAISIVANAQSTNPHSTNALQIPKGRQAIILPETETMIFGSEVNIGSNSNGHVTVEVKNPSQRLLPPMIRDVIAGRPVNLCDALNYFTPLRFHCYPGEINNANPMGAGNWVIQCLPSSKICFVGVESPI